MPRAAGSAAGASRSAAFARLPAPFAAQTVSPSSCTFHYRLPAQVECGDQEAARKVEEKIAAFHTWAQRNPGKRGQVGAGRSPSRLLGHGCTRLLQEMTWLPGVPHVQCLVVCTICIARQKGNFWQAASFMSSLSTWPARPPSNRRSACCSCCPLHLPSPGLPSPPMTCLLPTCVLSCLWLRLARVSLPPACCFQLCRSACHSTRSASARAGSGAANKGWLHFRLRCWSCSCWMCSDLLALG